MIVILSRKITRMKMGFTLLFKNTHLLSPVKIFYDTKGEFIKVYIHSLYLILLLVKLDYINLPTRNLLFHNLE